MHSVSALCYQLIKDKCVYLGKFRLWNLVESHLLAIINLFWPVRLCFAVALGRNQPLKREKPKWKSDYPMTDGQLRSKRDEFWDTAPAFEGRKEIWDALKAAAQAFESNDHELAQAIIDGASITLPHGKRHMSPSLDSNQTLVLTKRFVQFGKYYGFLLCIRWFYWNLLKILFSPSILTSVSSPLK